MTQLKVGAIDAGGGTRSIFGAGVLDKCMDFNINFDHFVGVSAGSANGASYLAGQRGRNLVFFNDYAFRKEYMSVEHFIKTGSYLNFDYIFGTLSNEDGEYPLDYDKMMANKCGFEIVATNAVTGRPIYFNKKEIEFEVAERVAGKSSFSFRKLIKLAMQGLTSFSTLPLKLSTYLGLFMSFISFILLLVYFIKALLYGDPVAGFPTIITVVLLLGGLQLLFLGIIGEYIGRIFNETKGRPIYLISETNIDVTAR